MKRKQERPRFSGCGIIAVVGGFTLFFLVMILYYSYIAEEEVIKWEDLYFTENEYTISQLEDLLFCFEMETSPDYKEEIERNPDRIDFEYIDLEVTDQTYEAVTVINHFLFDGFDGKDGDAIQRANEMGCLLYTSRCV